jgi:nucleoside-diphosphate-sugar epimerase
MRDVDVLVHAAFLRAGRTVHESSRRNIGATVRAYGACAATEARFVFLSSLSATPQARSEYGRHKYALERALANCAALVLRPGLIVGNGGLIAALHAAVLRGFVPLVDGGTQLAQVVGIDDLADAILLSLGPRLAGSYTVCAAESITIRAIAESLAERADAQPRYLSIPWRPAFAGASLAEAIGLTLPLTTENLWGLRNTTLQMPSAELQQLGWRARDWRELLPALTFDAGSTGGGRRE